MSPIRNACLLTAALWLSTPAHFVAQQPPAINRSPGAAGFDAADVVQQVTEFEINGLRVLVKRREGSETVAAALFLRGGARNISSANAGIESLMLHMATESTVSFPRERLRRELARTGTVLNAGVNLDYSGLTLASTRQHFDEAWEIFVDAALRPSFALDDFQRIKQLELIALSDDEDTPDSYLQILTSRQVYAGHPYLSNPRGTVDSMRRLTLEGVRQYHQSMMQTSRMLLVIVGDIEPAVLKEKVEDSLGELPRGSYEDTPIPQLSFQAPTVTITARDLPTNYVQGIFTAPPITSPDVYAMHVATSLLRERFFTEIRVRRSLSYAPDASLHSLGANTGSIYFTAVDANQTVQVMMGEIGRLQRDLIRPEEIQSVAQQFLTTYYMGQETNAAQTRELAEYELIGGGWRNSAEVLGRLRAVTPEDVRRVANMYIRNIQFVVVGNPQSINEDVFRRP